MPKRLVLEVFAAALGTLWLFRHHRGETRRLPLAVIVAASALAGWWIVTTVLSVHPATALWGAHGRYNGLATHLTLLFVCLLAASSPIDVAGISRQMRAFVLVLVPVSIYALVQFAGGDPITWGVAVPRSGSTIGNPVVLAAVLGLGMPFALVFALRAPGRAGRWSWSVVLLTLLAAAITTLSRGPLIASVIAMLAIVAVMAWERRQGWSRWTLGAVAIAAAVVVVGGYFLIVQARIRTGGGDPEATGRDRLYTYTAAAQILRDHPVTGVGLENFSVVYPQYRSTESDRLTPDVMPTMVHNGYLQAAATTGVPGLIAYLVFVAVVLATIVRVALRTVDSQLRWLALAFAAAITAYGIQDLTGWLELSLSTCFWLVMGFGLALAARNQDAGPLSAWPHRLATIAVGVGVIAAAGSAVQTVGVLQTDARFRTLSALGPQAGTAVDAAAAMALSGSGLDAVYLDKAGLRYAERFAATGAVETYRQAAGLFTQARALNPFDPYIPMHHMALETVALQRKVIAESAVDSAVPELIARDPNNGSTHETVARLRLAQGRAADALVAAQRALELRPKSGRYHELHGDIERTLGRRGPAAAAYRAASELLVESNPTAWITVSHKLILMLLEDKQPEQALLVAQTLLEKQPGDGLGRTLLGYTYLALQDEARARAAFADAVRINPRDQNAAQALASIGPQSQRPASVAPAPAAPAAAPAQAPALVPSDRVITSSQFGQEIELRSGETIVLRPPFEAAEWQVDFSADVLQLLTPANQVSAPGAGGWRFRAVRAGATDLAITAQPSAGTPGPAAPRRFSLTVRVR